MNEQHNTPTQKSVIIKFIVIAVAVAIMWVLYSVYISKTITWNDVYDVFRIKQDVAANDEPTEEGTALATDGVRVSFVDVGQGDSIVIEAGESVVVIDTGDYAAEQSLKSFLEKEGIDEIDYLIATHPHSDHIGNMEALIENYRVDKVVFPYITDDLTPTNSTYVYLLKTIDKNNIPLTIPAVGEKIVLDKGEITVLYNGGGSDINNSSLVLMYVYGESSFLLMGDAEFEVEDKLCDEYGRELSCDVLKAGHHGTKYATGNNILSAASADYVVIMCGIDNEYGYPKEAVLKRIASEGAAVLRTDLDGDISFLCDEQSFELSTKREG